MFRPNRLKAKLKSGDPTRGCWLFLGSPAATEVLSHAGFDALIIDQEHSEGGLETATHQLRAAARSQTTLLARLSDNHPTQVKQLLDAGVEGLLAPNVESADEVQRLVDAAYYPPRGRRGAHFTVSRAAGCGAWSQDYFERIEDEVLLVAMIESERGVKAIPDMARVQGLDMVFIGPLDLSASIGVTGQWDAPAYKALVAEAEEAARAGGLLLGSTELPGDAAAALFARGYRFVTVGSDFSFLRKGAASALATNML